MPTIDVDYKELERLLNKKLNGDMDKLDDILVYVKGEVKTFNEKDGTIDIEMKDTNRPDLWSVEGLCRALRSYLNLERGPKQYSTNKSNTEVTVSTKLWNIRPYICCSVIKNINLSDKIIRGIMHLQEKLDQTTGRNRQKTSIGIYNFDLVKPPIEYTAVKPRDVSFIPLGFTEKMSLDEILENHPKGIEYSPIVKAHSFYPMLFDSEGKVLSFPPIINSNDLGKITEESRNLLIEVTGTQHKTVLDTLNLITLALIDRGGKAYFTTIKYPQQSDYSEKTVETPNFSCHVVTLSVEYTNNLLGLKLTSKQISELLLTAGLGVEKVSADKISVQVPCYRVDIMQQVDIIEDIAIAYGYNNIEPLWRQLPTTGQAKSDQCFINTARELMIGLEYQEILSYNLTNQETLFQKMNLPQTKLIELSNPKITTMTCLRNWLLPSLMEFLSINQSVEFPQKIFELGKVTLVDETQETRTRDEDWLAAVTTHPNANFSEIKSGLDSLISNFGLEWEIKRTIHPSFIEGRVGSVIVGGVEVGVLGEVNPLVLEAWKLENSVAAFELNFQKIIQHKKRK